MRLIITLEPVSHSAYDMQYYNKLQGFLYNLIRNTEFDVLHDKEGYKFFCFSNIFPYGENKPGVLKKPVISSPSRAFISFIGEKLESLMEDKKEIRIGEMLFKIDNIQRISQKVHDGCAISVSTPITLRIPERNYDAYGVAPEKRSPNYIYWRQDVDFNAFVKQLTENLFKKYDGFYGAKTEQFPLFEQYKFVRQTCNHLVINGKEYKVIGSLWDFMFTRFTREQKRLLDFGIDCGFGERNTYGFGFVNVR